MAKKSQAPAKKTATKSKVKKVSVALPSIEKIAHVTDQSVFKYTQKHWHEWIDILEKSGARILSHKEIVALIRKKFKVTIWWQHEVATGYEVYTGKKLPGRNAKGLYSMTVTKTFPFTQKEVWKFLSSEEGLQIWLKPMSPLIFAPKSSFEVEGGIFGEIRTMKSPLRTRILWLDSDWVKPTFLQIYVIPRPKKKCMVVFMHEAITTSRIKDDLRVLWRTGVEDMLAAMNAKNEK